MEYYHQSPLYLVYKYMICIKSKKREDKYFTLNVSGFGFNRGLQLCTKTVLLLWQKCDHCNIKPFAIA